MGELRLVLVNHCHPSMPHVCAMRAREFAHALTRRGHRTILLTESLHPDDISPPPTEVAERLTAHDWSQPFLIACRPVGHTTIARARRGGLAQPFNKLALAWSYLFGDGPFSDWVDGSRAYWPVVIDRFAPHAVWGVFGNTGALAIAQGIARLGAAPWILDIKDGWTAFIPTGVRDRVAKQFTPAAVTALSEAQAASGSRWDSHEPTVVYSGLPKDLLEPAEKSDAITEFRIALIGSIYDRQRLSAMVDGIRAWLQGDLSVEDRQRVRIAHYGAPEDAVTEGLRPLETLCRVTLEGFRPLDEMIAATRATSVNLYVRQPGSLLQHKLFELLACARPIICLPVESAEAQQIVAEIGGVLYSCADPKEVRAALDEVWRGEFAAPETAGLERYTWDAQAAVLERVIESVRVQR